MPPAHSTAAAASIRFPHPAPDDLHAEQPASRPVGHHPQRDRLGLRHVAAGRRALGDQRDRVVARGLGVLAGQAGAGDLEVDLAEGEAGDTRFTFSGIRKAKCVRIFLDQSKCRSIIGANIAS